MATEPSFWDAIGAIRETDDRFRPEAYAFLMNALLHTVEKLPAERQQDPARRHLSGRELLEGMTGMARREFGDLAPMVFSEWGVRRSEDVGEMVFQLVHQHLLRARPEDTPEDFRDYDLEARLAAATSPPGA